MYRLSMQRLIFIKSAMFGFVFMIVLCRAEVSEISDNQKIQSAIGQAENELRQMYTEITLGREPCTKFVPSDTFGKIATAVLTGDKTVDDLLAKTAEIMHFNENKYGLQRISKSYYEGNWRCARCDFLVLGGILSNEMLQQVFLLLARYGDHQALKHLMQYGSPTLDTVKKAESSIGEVCKKYSDTSMCERAKVALEALQKFQQS